MSHTVVGLFNNADTARNAVQKLVDDGFENSNIDCSYSGSTTSGGADTGRRDHESGIEKFFRNLFGDDDDTADKYSRAGKNNTVVTVHATSDYEAKRAADLLDDFGAIDVDEDETSYSGDNIRAESDATTSDRRDTDTTRKIPVVEENLEVGKREVQTGGVRVRSRVIEKPVEENLRLREETVNIERKPVDRDATASDLDTFQDKEIEMTERKEVPLVNKEARVTEEITVNKETDVRNETVRDTLKKTEVDVENLNKNRTAEDGNL
ncbi:MAG: hypothetical protein JWN76_804 [Chitinophagaceae bacterium]|nr:hypothetical protein [Chitinophagaceae bacterium]